MKRLICALLCLALVLAPVSALAEEWKYEGYGFDNPEAAVQAYIEAFNAGDVQRMLSTFAIETVTANTDPVASAKRQSAFVSGTVSSFPMIDDYTRALAVQKRVSEITALLAHQFLRYAMPEAYGVYDGAIIPFKDDADAKIEGLYSAFDQSVFKDWFGQIEVVEVITPEGFPSDLSEKYRSESIQSSIEKVKTVCGCEDITDCIAHIRIMGEDYLQFMQCCRYDGKWYNYSMYGTAAIVAGLETVTGGLIPYQL